MRFLVNSVAASSSGALGVLQEYYQRSISDLDNQFVFLVSTPEFVDTKNVTILRFPWVKRSWLHRLIFDWVVAPFVVRRERPDRILSLQNLTMHLTKVPQTVYEHNCIPPAFCDYRFKFAQEPALWIRQNILGRMIQHSLKKADRVIVQTRWMKQRCVGNLGIEADRITIEPPVLSNLPRGEYKRSDPIQFLYPATPMCFKRHDLIVDAVRLLVKHGYEKEFRIIFTLTGDENDSVRRICEEVGRSDLPIVFSGWLSRESLFESYTKSALLFASETESFPLPLVEAASVKAPIVVPNLEYAHEALGGYEEATFFNPGDAESLMRAMLSLIK